MHDHHECFMSAHHDVNMHAGNTTLMRYTLQCGRALCGSRAAAVA
jgi:hypothetical protein